MVRVEPERRFGIGTNGIVQAEAGPYRQGFSVRFEPDAVLSNEQGKVVARAGERTELSQTRPKDPAATFADPCITSGLLLSGCDPFA